ncbi:MAG: MBL fold metallo-hydrolase, partial [Bdellovibrio sp.]|nr:MBL fold metallo-hydrolase [Bdellovibrio sp.]
MKISFLGGAGTVTGSKFLVSAGNDDVLIDCGLFQGPKQLRLLNWEIVPVNVERLRAVFLTHAHLDHCGHLPLLVKQGFRGPIYCSRPTKDLAQIILMDSAKIQMEDADYANKKKFSKHHPALPLYDLDDVEKTLPLFQTVELNQENHLGSFTFKYSSSGHILGACSVSISNRGTRVLFSGDLGRYNDPLMYPPDNPQDADVVVMESTYGDHNHDKITAAEILEQTVNNVWNRKGVLLIPAFAVGRFQNLMYDLIQLKRQGRIPRDIPIYLNSPMGAKVCELYQNYHDFQKLEPGEFEEYMSSVRFVETADDSKALNMRSGPMVIIAASGMLSGGRVLHHLKAFAGDRKNIILLAGYQATGTRGASLAAGDHAVKVHGNFVEIKAEVITSDS